MWENLVGRSRPFWRCFYPQLQAALPGRIRRSRAETFYRAINKVEPSLIRVEADEATYNLHIILRFELEQEIFDGDARARGPARGLERAHADYLGVEVPDDAHGVLQDVHWPGGAFGYFPTYSLGNVISVQLWEQGPRRPGRPRRAVRAGRVRRLSGWLRENLHRHGRKYTPKEMLERITGGGMDPGPYIRYLKSKLGEIYGLPVPAGVPA